MPVDPPRPKPPPLTALRAFEAAARLGGFARAAEELAVSPGAVSQHIRTLEDWAGVTLFIRNAQGVRLTAAGARVLPLVSEAFDGLGQAAQTLRAAAGDVLSIAALPSFAQLWLSPRLPRLRAALPGVTISVTALERPPNLLREPFSLALFPGAQGQYLAQDALFPVCTPELARRLHRTEDLLSVPCLGDTIWTEDWPLWLQRAGGPAQVSGPGFSLYALALAEALNGAGVLMGRKLLVAPHLQSGALVRPFPLAVPLPDPLRALTPPEPLPGPVRRLLDLLREDL
ncbi:LysR family transcriptional regulator [Salipiger sp. P9]|uniref:LysR family transcriptional regulator n=1 Tax=Salipiger pentaromativorans TaxID=2943193 RepID=UPI00215825BE|nr:LysR family transcriptional regulator [Salipiger pentaromativorans]MCR8548092.1 LysR family transcriptional regulator [Salipiger pentaromativorans]